MGERKDGVCEKLGQEGESNGVKDVDPGSHRKRELNGQKRKRRSWDPSCPSEFIIY